MSNEFNKLSFEHLSKGDRTRLRIVEAVAQCILRDGGTRLTFEAVGIEVGMNRAQVRYHFPRLDELVLEASKWVAHESQASALESLTSAKTARQRVENYIEVAFLSSLKVRSQIPVLMHSYERGLHEKDFQKLYEILSDAGNARLAALLGDMLSPLGCEADSLGSLTFAIRSLLTGMVLDMHLRHQTAAVDRFILEAKSAALALIARLVADGLGVDRSSKTGAKF